MRIGILHTATGSGDLLEAMRLASGAGAGADGVEVVYSTEAEAQMLGSSDKVGKGVPLIQQLAVIVPVAAHLAPTPHVRNGKDETAVKDA